MGASASTNSMSTFALSKISHFGEHEMQELLKQSAAIARREGAEDHTITASELRWVFATFKSIEKPSTAVRRAELPRATLE